jgi:hypothetical protein
MQMGPEPNIALDGPSCQVDNGFMKNVLKRLVPIQKSAVGNLTVLRI